jgi:hypothetical protein
VNLADRCGGGRLVVELGELRPPVLAETFGEHLVHRGRRQRGGRLLEFGQRGAVRAGDLGRQRCLEDRQHLAHLHGAALELAEHLEQLLRGALLDLEGDHLGGPADRPLPHSESGAAGESERQGR